MLLMGTCPSHRRYPVFLESHMNRFALVAILFCATVGVASAVTVTLHATADNRLLSFSPNTNDNQEFIGTYTTSGNEQRTLIQFDYSSLSGMTVLSATLRLYGASFSGSSAATSMDLYRVTQDWSETSSCWSKWSTGNNWANPGGDAVGTTGSQLTNPFGHWSGPTTTTGAWYSIDATSLVSQTVGGTFANQGMLLTGVDGGQLSFISREGHSFHSLGSTNVPELVVEVVPEPASLLALAGLVGIVVLKQRSV